MIELFSKELNRLKLISYKTKDNNKKIKILIHRNHSFEIISRVLNAFLDFSNLSAEFVYSSYDDSLNFNIEEADLNIIWIDTKKYKTNVVDFLQERLQYLRTNTQAPILLFYTGEMLEHNIDITDTYIVHTEEFISYLGDSAYDLEKEPFSGTRLSSKALLEIARIIGLKYIPAIIKSALKAIIVDLDNTLYQGILGEDGIDNLIPNLEFQKQLKELKNKGFFICIASKNNEQDVKEMFRKRTDFLIKEEDFTIVKANWESKAENIKEIAKLLNIHPDSMLFIDDNPAEIQNVEHIGINTLLADENIYQIIKYYPGLLKLRTSNEDLIRSKDINANIERAKLVKELSPKEYFEKLGIKLTFGINQQEQIPRVTELLGKTNQFILTYCRFKETIVKEYMESKDKCVVTVKMEDNLSDSGIIAILLASKNNSKLILDELTVSCRALGRNLENIMLPKAFDFANKTLNTDGTIIINYKKGERNLPALSWLEKLTNTKTENSGNITYVIPNNIDMTGLKEEVICD